MTAFSTCDIAFMRRALDLSRAAKGQTFPNPAVGAVIVKRGKIIAEGATRAYGGLHAEAVAIACAGKSAAGASMYVTLEPCCHTGNTPPCARKIIESGIVKVFVSCKDPNPLVSGKGLNMLRRSGIEVEYGLLEDEAGRINEDFFWSIVNRKPWITLKLAMTLDGRIADYAGNSRWITGKAARVFVHDLRRKHAAIAVGGNTLAADNPRLNVRHLPGVSPVRIVFSSNPDSLKSSYFRTHCAGHRSIVVCRKGRAGTKETLRDGFEIWYTGRSLKNALYVFGQMAYQENLTSILVEGGAGLASSLLESGMVNRLYLFYGTKLLGSGLAGVSFKQNLALGNAVELKRPELIDFGNDFAITGVLNRGK
jgi:diaminohydroxyphosphoribosylaminopyrimidine deaminase/5-amino-6-(5-phosphoribosylamino)uracil reductase